MDLDGINSAHEWMNTRIFPLESSVSGMNTWPTVLNYTWKIILWQKINMRTQITFHWVTMLFILLVGSELQFFENIWVYSMRYQDEECHRSNILFTERLHRQSWTANHLILLVSSNLPLHADWKFGPGCISHWGLPAPQPRVLFSECAFICGCLLFLSNYSQNVSRFFVKEQSHFLAWMCNTDVPCCYFWAHRMLSSGHNGLWSLCGIYGPSCVQSAWLPESTCHSALLPMWVASCMLLYTQWPLSASPSVPPVKSDTSSVTSLPSSLFVALTLTASALLLCGLYWDGHCPDCPDLLWPHPAGHSEDAFCWRQKESLFYMWLSPNWSVHLPWDHPLHVLETKFQLCFRPWHDCVNIL